jgi:hypothetical protein
MNRFSYAGFFLFIFAAGGCSSSSSSAASTDAGSDALIDAADEMPVFVPEEDAGLTNDDAAATDANIITHPDAETPCQMLADSIAALVATVRTCNPQLPNECNAAAQGICCPFSVDINNTEAASNLSDAVMQYQMQCAPTCNSVCGTNIPSRRCVAETTNTGLCQ